MWPDEWNRRSMRALQDAEVTAGRPLTRDALLKRVGENVWDKPMTDGRSWQGIG